MTGTAFAILAALLSSNSSASADAASTISDAGRAEFARLVQQYQDYKVPHCAPEMTGAYASYSRDRDIAFVRSLTDTELLPIYRQAMKNKSASDASKVFHCFGPSSPDHLLLPPRERAIRDAQERLQGQAKAVSPYFDAGDGAFVQLVAARDRLLDRKEP